MCGRFVQGGSKAELEQRFMAQSEDWLQISPHYNHGPAQQIPLVWQRGTRRLLDNASWGVEQEWTSKALINARVETAAAKPSFAELWQQHRCIIPARGFYEWQRDQAGGKQPWFFSHTSELLVGFAGLLQPDADDKPKSCLILTTAANELVAPVHGRMPVMLAREGEESWLQGADPIAEKLTLSLDELQAWPVSPVVGSIRQNSPHLMDRFEPPAEPEQLSFL